MSAALLSSIVDAYVQNDGALSNEDLYEKIGQSSQLALDFNAFAPVGESQALVNLTKRRVRWCQQSLRAAGVITRVAGKRGVWELATHESKGLQRLDDNMAVLGFSTKLGIAIIGSCQHFFSTYDGPLHAIITSPPYPLRQARAYGNTTAAEYVDWICATMEPAIKAMADGASLALNISNDIFEPGSPARSTYVERLIIAFEDRLGLKVMDRLIWENPSKPPGPIAWASKKRVQLGVSYEPVIWFTNNVQAVFSDNRRVLRPHSDQHAKLIARGGEGREASYCDGAYRIRPGSFANRTEGKIPRNILKFPHISHQHRAYRAACAAEGLQAHGAMMPYGLARFLVEFLTLKGQRVADIFGGSGTLAQACEDTEREWVLVERALQYVRGSGLRLKNAAGFEWAPVWGDAAGT